MRVSLALIGLRSQDLRGHNRNPRPASPGSTTKVETVHPLLSCAAGTVRSAVLDRTLTTRFRQAAFPATVSWAPVAAAPAPDSPDRGAGASTPSTTVTPGHRVTGAQLGQPVSATFYRFLPVECHTHWLRLVPPECLLVRPLAPPGRDAAHVSPFPASSAPVASSSPPDPSRVLL